jgi:hypothetical protein
MINELKLYCYYHDSDEYAIVIYHHENTLGRGEVV